VFKILLNNVSFVHSPKKFKVGKEDSLHKFSLCAPELGTLEWLKVLSEHQHIAIYNCSWIQKLAELLPSQGLTLDGSYCD